MVYELGFSHNGQRWYLAYQQLRDRNYCRGNRIQTSAHRETPLKANLAQQQDKSNLFGLKNLSNGIGSPSWTRFELLPSVHRQV